jgi:hypothetical protein
MPAESSLPKSLAPFAARQAIEISDQGFREEARTQTGSAPA